MSKKKYYTKLKFNTVLGLIVLLIAPCCVKPSEIHLWGSPVFLNHADFFMGEHGDGAAIKDTVIYITNDGGVKWNGPISLDGYMYSIYPSNSLRNRYKIYNSALYFHVVEKNELCEKRIPAESPKRHLARFNLSTFELTVNSECFSDIDDIFIKDGRMCARVDRCDIVECDESLNICSRSKLPFSCLSLVPTSNGYCTTHPRSVKFIEGDVVSSIDLGRYCLNGPLFSSEGDECFTYCSDDMESVVIKIRNSGSMAETCQVFPEGTCVDFFSSDDAFFFLTISDNYKYYLVYSLDGGRTWSRKKIPLSIAATCHLAYYDGKLFY